ncbi:MAG: UDP-2,3-diacylglucosamine diphosphatase [Pseudomonadota bacterium]
MEADNSDDVNPDGKKHYPAIFLSDIHLGTKDCQAELLLDFLKHHTCDRLYLVGDIIDGWRMKSSLYWPQPHNDVLRRFLTLAKRGTKVIYVTGNHDEFLRRYSQMTFGNLELVDEAEHWGEDGRRYLVIHGDQFDVVTLHHRWLAFLGDKSYEFLLRMNRVVNWARKRLGKEHWSLAKYLKHKVKRAVNFISEFEEALAAQCRRLGFEGVVCGHIHHAEITSYGEITYMNCGDWVESCTALVERTDGQFEILRWGVATGEAAGDVVPLVRPEHATADVAGEGLAEAVDVPDRRTA